MINGLVIEDLTTARAGLVNTVKSRLEERKERERVAKDEAELRKLAETFKSKIREIKHDFERQKLLLNGLSYDMHILINIA